jgi:hypothetical protein
MKLRRPLTLLACITLGVGVCSTTPAQAAGNTLTVDVGSTVRPVTHVAAGGLYGVDTGDDPPLSLLQPLRFTMFTQPPPGTQQLGNGATHPCCDALSVAGKVTSAGAQQYVRLPDIFSTFPYDWVSWSDWESKVRTAVGARVNAQGTTNIAGYEVWNEPDCNWSQSTKNDPNAGSYLDAWTRTYRIIRSVDTQTPVIGPGACVYDHDWMLAFMTNAKNTGTLPQVAVWHELQNFSYDNVQAHVDDFRAIENSLGLPHVPISINEYASPDQVDVPSIGVHYMASLERAGVHDAERAYWYEAGTLNGLLHDNEPTASYWAYKWYGDMAGNVVRTTPQSSLDGVASYDSSRKVVNVVFGGDSGSNTVKVNGLSGLGSSVQVTLSSTPGTGRTTDVAAPTRVSSTTYPVNGGSISVPVGGMDAKMAYQLLITPAAGPTTSWQQTYEAENATVVNAQTRSSASASNGSYVGGIDGSGDARSDSFVDFLVDVPTSGSYSMAVRYANGGPTTSTQGLAYDGGAFTTISYPRTGAWGSPTGRVSVPLQLTAGRHVVRLAKGAPGFGGGVGYAELDSITLTPR